MENKYNGGEPLSEQEIKYYTGMEKNYPRVMRMEKPLLYDQYISLVKEMIQDVDHSSVIDSGVIDSPVLGKIPPLSLSGGVKTLILVLFEPGKIFNASTCGDNCAKWLLRIASSEDRTVNLRHIMDFGRTPFEIRVLNTDQIVHSMNEFTEIAINYV